MGHHAIPSRRQDLSSSSSASRDVPEPGPVAIVTDGNAYTAWAPGFRDAILQSVPTADVRLGIDVASLASRVLEDGLVGIVWLSHSPAGLREALDVRGNAVRWVQLPSAGIEKHAGVIRAHPELIWTTAKGAFAEPVAEHGLALTLALLRYLPARVVAKRWGIDAGHSLYRRNVVILGAGGISLAYLGLITPFHCTAQIVRRNAHEPLDLPTKDEDASGGGAAAHNVDLGKVSVHGLDALDALLPRADVLFLACALTDETRGLINARTLALLPPHCILINVGRGGLVVTPDLVEALRGGRLGGAGLDVTDPEPLPDEHPLFSLTTATSATGTGTGTNAYFDPHGAELVRERANVIITPHTADTKEMVRPLLSQRTTANVKALYERSCRFEGLIRIDGDHVY